MRLKALILLSVLGYSFGERLKVKCGDELCEKPSNRAVTTLRYTPDKPYKLQINSVNSEVEIFGATDDLFYIRYGRNFGFLPKNHLREKARGNFLHSVEIDIASFKINQEVRETNYLHEFIKSSSQASSEPIKNINDSSNETIENENVNNKNEDIKITDSANVEQIERPKEFIPIGTEPKIEPASIKSEEKTASTEAATETDNDSGVEEDDEDGEEEIDDGEEEEENSSSETTEQPELIAIPPNKNVAEEVPAMLVENTTLPQEELTKNIPEPTPIDDKSSQPETTDTPPIEKETKQTDNSEKNETQPTVEQQPEKVDIVELQRDEIPPAPVTEEIIEDFQELKKEEIPLPPPATEKIVKDEEIIETTTEAVPKVLDPPETVTEIPETTIEIQMQNENPETPQNETTTITEEEKKDSDIDASQVIEQEEFTKLPELNIDIPTTQNPEEIQETTTLPTETVPDHSEEKQKIIEEEPSKTSEKHEHKFDQDMLLKRFDEKLGRGSSEGVGSIKQINRDHQHHHHGDHSHSHDSHSHESHSHFDDNKPKQQQPEIIEVPDEIEEQKPGFLSGIMNKIFGSKSEASQENSNDETGKISKSNSIDEGFCEKIDSESCPKFTKVKSEITQEGTESKWMTSDEYIRLVMHEAIERMDLIISMGLVAVTVLIFIFGYYCINKARKEGPLLAKMNDLERHLMASVKENEMLKSEIVVTKQKLVSIEDNSFGSNDMVIALKNDLEISEKEKLEMQEKISSLEKELEAAAEDGLELNRMVSELLSSQTGSDSIISSVEDLQRQLNEQQETILTMNETIAVKSRENTELQIQLAEINGKCNNDLEKSQQTLDALALERNNLQIELENLKRESDMQVNQIIEERNGEVTRLNNELTSYAGKYDETKKLLNSAEAKVQALEECIETFKKGKSGGVDIKGLLDVADLKADLLAVTKEKSTIQEQLQTERDSRKLLEDRVKSISEEMSNLKKEFVTSDKEKHEAQTRLEVLSTYFKEKEMQLQQELSVKEARWMKQQGEKTSTVEKIQALNDEIQALKSQNDALRAEIEAQAAAHKLNITTTETQAHTSWLNAKQAERRLEEARMEAAALRRRLTSIAENPSGASDLLNGLPGVTNDSINSIPSPIRVESPNNVNQMAPPPLMMPPPFLPGAPPFLPPFLPPPGDLPMPIGMGMPPPLGRLMSPPPKRYTPTMRDDRNRFSPRGGRRYSPDSRYDDDDYTAFETETDYSPPRTPTPPRRGYSSPTDRSKKSKDLNQQSRRK